MRDEGMSKINIGQNIFTQTMPVTLLGTKINDKPNFMTLAWVHVLMQILHFLQ